MSPFRRAGPRALLSALAVLWTASAFASAPSVEELRQREMADRYRTHLASVVEGLKKRYVVEVHPELMVSGK